MLKLNRSKIIVVSLFMGGVLLGTNGIMWWKVVYNSPERVFDRMLTNSLASPSVTKVISQSNDSQGLKQITVLQTEPKQIAHSVSIVGQTADPDTKVTTESIGTTKADFVRYSDIKTSQKNAQGAPFDFSSVLGVWGKTDANNPDNGDVQQFNQAVFGVVPVANLPQPLRSQFAEQIKASGVYKADMSSVKRQVIDGRPVYSYSVKVVPVAYISLLKNFARAIGLTQLERIDPTAYTNSPPLDFTFDVDVWSGELTKVVYSDSARTEIYGSYGAQLLINTPSSSIPIDELQTRLQQIR